jgi:tetratricopeptide (TPR) repeat protein
VAATFHKLGATGRTVLASGDRIAPGDRLALDFRATRPTWVYVLDADDRGECYLLFPQPLFDRANPVPADSALTLPGTRSGVESAWTVTSRGGREHLLVIANPEPLPELEATTRAPAGPRSRPVRRLRAGATRNPGAPARDRRPSAACPLHPRRPGGQPPSTGSRRSWAARQASTAPGFGKPCWRIRYSKRLMFRPWILLAALCLAPLSAAAQPLTTLDSLGLFETRNQWAQAESVARVLDERVASTVPFDSLAHAHNLIAIGRARSYRRMFGDPATFASLEGGIALRARHAPAGDRSLARRYLVGATVFPEAGRPQDALRYAEAGTRVMLAASPPDTLILASLELARANALVALGRPAEARPVYERSIALSEMKFGPSNRVMVGKLAEYGVFLSRLGAFDEGRAALRRAIALAERDTIVHGDLLDGSLSRLSTLEDRAGNLAESIALARRAYEIALRRDGPDAVPTARLRIVLAYRLDELGDRAGAAAHLREILPVLEEKGGREEPADRQRAPGLRGRPGGDRRHGCRPRRARPLDRRDGRAGTPGQLERRGRRGHRGRPRGARGRRLRAPARRFERAIARAVAGRRSSRQHDREPVQPLGVDRARPGRPRPARRPGHGIRAHAGQHQRAGDARVDGAARRPRERREPRGPP